MSSAVAGTEVADAAAAAGGGLAAAVEGLLPPGTGAVSNGAPEARIALSRITNGKGTYQ